MESNPQITYGMTGDIDAQKLALELIIMIALKADQEAAVKIMEDNGVKVTYGIR